jgi:hypothetical protein
MRRFLVAAGMFACTLAGCSGSGGTANAVSPPVTTAAPTPTPTPTPTPDPHPVTDGGTVTFEDVSTTTDTQPSAPPTMTSSTTTVTETTHTGATFNGHTAVNVRTVAADGSFTNDNYEGYVPTPSGQNYVAYGQTGSFTKNQVTQTYVNPDPIIIDEIPEVAGATWTNSVALNVTVDSGPANQHVHETEVRQADGSEVHTYTHTDGTPADTVTNTYTMNANVTGSIVHQAPTGSYQFTIGQPVKQGAVFVIPITYTDANGPQIYTVPDYYPGNGPPPPTYTFGLTDLGTQLPPAVCSKAPQIPATHVHSAQTFYNVFGNVGNLVEDLYFTASRGLICYTNSETQLTYDVVNDGALVDTFTTTDVYTLTSGLGIISGQRRPNSVAAAYAFLHRSPRSMRDGASARRALSRR